MLTLAEEHASFIPDYADLADVAEVHGVPIHRIRHINQPETVDLIRGLVPDIIFVFGWSQLVSKEVIEIAPLAFMRGRTLNDAFIILDEAQNTTHEQMKMFLTRMGFHSKTVITGDITQIDLPGARSSGLVEALEIFDGSKGFAFIQFTQRDVVRHPLVQDVVDRYEHWEKKARVRDDGQS